MLNKSILDDVTLLRQFDPGGMLEALYGLPEQCRLAWQLGLGAVLPHFDDLTNIVVSGMGGSAIGGDLLRQYAAFRLKVPLIVNRDYKLPYFITKKSLVFAVSYSGNTEETLSVYQEARLRGAALVAITTGGRLKEIAQQDNIPVVTIPAGLAPRSAIGYLFLPTLAVLQRLGLIVDADKEVEELVAHLQEIKLKLSPEVPTQQNQAKKIAHDLLNRIPVIWGSCGTTEVIAQRWKGQFNENAKAPAYWNNFPELNHNEIVGFEFPEKLLKYLQIIILNDAFDHPRVKRRIEITKNIIKDKVAGITEVHSSGNGELARIYSLIYPGDYASIYLAILYGIDPKPVNVIDYLKGQLESVSD